MLVMSGAGGVISSAVDMVRGVFWIGLCLRSNH